MNTPADIATALTASRPQAIAALLRYFRDLDTAEEAYQEASLRALKHWPAKGLPRDPLAWLIFVGRNVALDRVRHDKLNEPLPADELISDLDDHEARLAEQIDHAPYRDDLLRLLFVCCQPGLPAVQQIALALRVVSGLSVKEIARAFLVSDSAMEQRITRAKRRIAQAQIPFEAPGAAERGARLGAVSTAVYLLFNEGYSASGGRQHVRTLLCDEAIRLARLLAQLFPEEPEVAGLLALLLLQHARADARLDAQGAIILLDDQDRGRWSRVLIDEGLARVEQALRQRRPGPYQLQAAIAATHARAAHADDTDWAEIDRLYALLQGLQPTPVVALNRSVALAKLHGPAAALAFIAPLGEALDDYFHFHGVRGALLMQLERADEARAALTRALALARTAAEASHIRTQLDTLDGPARHPPRGSARPIA